MADPVRRLAVEVLDRVDSGAFLDHVLQAVEPDLEDQDLQRPRLRFLTIGAVKQRLRLDHELEHRLDRGLGSLPERARTILRLALFEARFGNAPGYAVVDDAVDLTRSFGLEGLAGVVNGVLRNALRKGEPALPLEPLERLAVQTSHPMWLMRRVTDRFGMEAARALAEWDNRPAPLWVRLDVRRVAAETFEEAAAEHGAVVQGHTGLPAYYLVRAGLTEWVAAALDEGWLTVQDPSAGLAGLAAGRVGGTALDLCAAPGGKTTHLAERAGEDTTLVATDSDAERYRMLCENLARHGTAGVVTRPYDAVVGETGGYDLVLVDAPCSNLGVLRRRADARWRVTEDDVDRLAVVQRTLLERAAELVGDDGVVIYSTCTILREENEAVVEGFLDEHPGFAAEGLPDDVPAVFRSGTGTAVSLPWRHGVDGAFVVRLRRQGKRP
jgi:16S rRNA (cytosine967-C5)-methyltransferase